MKELKDQIFDKYSGYVAQMEEYLESVSKIVNGEDLRSVSTSKLKKQV